MWRLPIDIEDVNDIPYDLFNLYLYRKKIDYQDTMISLYDDVPPPSDRCRLRGKFDEWVRWAQQVSSTDSSAKKMMKSCREAGELVWFSPERLEEEDWPFERWDYEGNFRG